MRIRNNRRRLPRKDELATTPMIDIVFLLLVFFIMTFRIVAPEGDFNLSKTARAAAGQTPVDEFQLPVITVRLTADRRGRLTGIRMNGRELADFDELRAHVQGFMRDAGSGVRSDQGPTVEFDCDYALDYEHVVDAVAAVSGYVDRGRVVQTAGKVRFAPARRGS